MHHVETTHSRKELSAHNSTAQQETPLHNTMFWHRHGTTCPI